MRNSATFQRDFVQRLGHGLHLAELFEHLPEVYLYVKDHRSRFVRANRALCRMHGCLTEADIIGRTDYDFHPPYLADRYVEEDRRVMQRQTAIPNQVWLVSGLRGDLKWCVSTKIPLFDTGGDVIGIAGAMRDFEKAESFVRPFREMGDVLAYVVRHHAQKIKAADLAHLAHLSVSQLDRRFKQIFQMTPQQYIQRVRINAACQALVCTQHSIATIAQETGFYDQSYFTKQFRQQMGMTPLSYRNRYREQILPSTG